MEFIGLLKAGCKPTFVAARFVQELVKASSAHEELSMDYAMSFINECLKAINFNVKLDVLAVQTGEFNWPKTWPTYTFNYNKYSFGAYDQFFKALSAQIKPHQEYMKSQRRLQMEDDDEPPEGEGPEMPMDWLMQVITVWYKVHLSLGNLKTADGIKPFEEPVARINFFLLCGVHDLRKTYRAEYPVLDKVCVRLYVSAVEGIYYREQHRVISTGILNIFFREWYVFHQLGVDALKFYHELLVCDKQRQTWQSTYMHLKVLLEVEQDENRLLLLTNFLIQLEMLQIYYTHLMTQKGKRLLLATLKFLQTLQSKIVSMDCFSGDFLNAFLAVAIGADEAVKVAACQVYAKIVKRKWPEDFILQHIMAFLITNMNRIDQIGQCVDMFWNLFPMPFEAFLKVAFEENTPLLIRYCALQFVVAVCNKTQNDDEQNYEQIKFLLKNLPALLEKLNDSISCDILLQVVRVIDKGKLKNHCTEEEFLEIWNKFEDYAADTFKDLSFLELPYLSNLLVHLFGALFVTSNYFKLDILVDINHKLYNQVERLIEDTLKKGEAPSKSTMDHYVAVLKRMNILIKYDVDVYRNFQDILPCLKANLIDRTLVRDFAAQYNSFLDCYILDILVSYITQKAIAIRAYEYTEYLTTLENNAIELHKYIKGILRNENALQKMPSYRVRILFNSLVSLYSTFAPHGVPQLKVSASDYQILTNVLLCKIFDPKTMRHIPIKRGQGWEETLTQPLRDVENKHLMLKNFYRLHMVNGIEITSNASWKIAIHYGMAKFQEFKHEIEGLLEALAKYFFKTYKHAMSVVLLNLYKRDLSDVLILKCIKAHSDFIDSRMPANYNSAIVKLSVVFQVMENVKKTLAIVPMQSKHNRLEALKHLHIFTENIIILEPDDTLDDIVALTNSLAAGNLNQLEITTLKDFARRFLSRRVSSNRHDKDAAQ